MTAYKDKIDMDKLTEFITNWFGTLRNFAYHYGSPYTSFYQTYKSFGNKEFNEKFYKKIIRRLNEWICIEWEIIKPTKEISELKFFKKI